MQVDRRIINNIYYLYIVLRANSPVIACAMGTYRLRWFPKHHISLEVLSISYEVQCTSENFLLVWVRTGAVRITQLTDNHPVDCRVYTILLSRQLFSACTYIKRKEVVDNSFAYCLKFLPTK